MREDNIYIGGDPVFENIGSNTSSSLNLNLCLFMGLFLLIFLLWFKKATTKCRIPILVKNNTRINSL